MEDSNIWYYLVLGLIYFISKAFGKKKQKGRPGRPAPQDGEQLPEQGQQIPEITFADILKELTGEKATPNIPTPAAEPEPQLTQPFSPHEQEVSPPAYSADEMDSIASAPLQSTYSAGLSAVEDRKRRKVDTFKRAEKYAIEEAGAVDYTDLLIEPNGPARAFVMHEIFSKKY
jgi:hypothetical protein